MSANKLQAGRMIAIFPSDNAPIPYPGVNSSGTNTELNNSKLIDNTATFQTEGITVGMIVYNITDSTAAVVVTVNSQISLTLNANIFTGTAKSYKIYSPPADQGACLYIGGTGDVTGVNESEDSVLFKALPTGSFVPVHFKQILSTGTDASYIVALW